MFVREDSDWQKEGSYPQDTGKDTANLNNGGIAALPISQWFFGRFGAGM
jgi:hypothetical protein